MACYFSTLAIQKLVETITRLEVFISVTPPEYAALLLPASFFSVKYQDAEAKFDITTGERLRLKRSISIQDMLL